MEILISSSEMQIIYSIKKKILADSGKIISDADILLALLECMREIGVILEPQPGKSKNGKMVYEAKIPQRLFRKISKITE